MSSPQQESFQSMATVFILQDKTWIERGSGLVRFVFDLRTFALRLVIRPGTNDEFECKLRPRIRSKGPRAYVVRAQADNGADEHILAVRFEREEDSRSFRRFVEKRDVDHNKTANNNNNNNKTQNNNNQYNNTTSNNNYNKNAIQQQQQYHNRHQQQQQMNKISKINKINKYGNYNTNNNNNNNNTNMYFWTCSRCLQMVDPASNSCHVCGTLRGDNNNNNNNNGNTSGNNNNNNNTSGYNNNQQQRHHHSTTTHATFGSSSHPHQLTASSMTPSNLNNINHPHYNKYNNHPQTVTNTQYIHHQHHQQLQQPQQQQQSHTIQQPISVILKLTTINLDKHNKLFPPKRRNVKEIIQAQLEYLRTHQ